MYIYSNGNVRNIWIFTLFYISTYILYQEISIQSNFRYKKHPYIEEYTGDLYIWIFLHYISENIYILTFSIFYDII